MYYMYLFKASSTKIVNKNSHKNGAESVSKYDPLHVTKNEVSTYTISLGKK